MKANTNLSFFLMHITWTSLLFFGGGCREEFLLRSHFWKHRREGWSVQGESRGWNSPQGNAVIWKGSAPALEITLSPLPTLSAPLYAPTHTSLAYYLRFVKIHFTLTGIFQPSKLGLICLSSQSSSNSMKSAMPAGLSSFSFFSFFFFQVTLNTPLPVPQRT